MYKSFPNNEDGDAFLVAGTRRRCLSQFCVSLDGAPCCQHQQRCAVIDTRKSRALCCMLSFGSQAEYCAASHNAVTSHHAVQPVIKLCLVITVPAVTKLCRQSQRCAFRNTAVPPVTTAYSQLECCTACHVAAPPARSLCRQSQRSAVSQRPPLPGKALSYWLQCSDANHNAVPLVRHCPASHNAVLPVTTLCCQSQSDPPVRTLCPQSQLCTASQSVHYCQS